MGQSAGTPVAPIEAPDSARRTAPVQVSEFRALIPVARISAGGSVLLQSSPPARQLYQGHTMSAHTLAAAAAEITAQQGLCKIVRFQDLGGSLTPPSDDPSEWWEPENLTHRADLHGIEASADNFFDAIFAWTKAAHQAGARHRRATDDRPDCPYNGQALPPAP